MPRFDIMVWTEELDGYRVVATANNWDEVHTYGKSHSAWRFFDWETCEAGICADVPAGVKDAWEI